MLGWWEGITFSPQVTLQNWGPAGIRETHAGALGCAARRNDSVKRSEPAMGGLFQAPCKFFTCFPSLPTPTQPTLLDRSHPWL